MSETELHCFSGDFTLQRRPPTPNQPLQAWDAADEYLLDTFAQADPRPERVLIINDQFGALTVGLHTSNPLKWGDSYTARLALEENLRRNGLADTVPFIPSTETPSGPAYDAVLWRVPKSLVFWQQQLVGLQPLLHEKTLLLVGGMVKHLPDTAKETLSALGTVEVLPVRKKALLLRVTPQTELPKPLMPLDSALQLTKYSLEIQSGSNVFAREGLDIGARFFLEQFSQLPKSGRIADLGCGNGVLGLVAKRLQPEATVYFFDESYQAVAAAEANYHRNGLASVAASPQFVLDDGLSHYAGEPFDLILCNPPFHQNHTIGDQIAWQMFTQSRRHLRPGGELWVVGNRHLNYHIKLKRTFSNYQQVAANPKFVVLMAQR